jgi:CHASE2 domain-containing sensor protein
MIGLILDVIIVILWSLIFTLFLWKKHNPNRLSIGLMYAVIIVYSILLFLEDLTNYLKGGVN